VSPPLSTAVAFQPHEARQELRLRIVLGLVSMFFVLELVGALAARSSVLQADAIHLMTDVFALGTSLVAMRVAIRRPTPRFTFGLRRVEPVVAIFNAFLVLGVTVEIVLNAIRALATRSSPEAGIMLVVASGALVVNGLSAWLLHDSLGHAHHDHDHDHGEDHDHDPDNPDDLRAAQEARGHGHALNVRGAWLHLLGDALGALAALVAAIVIRMGGPAAADPVASFVVAAILLGGSLRLLRDATLVLLEASPRHLPVETIREIIKDFPGVSAIHDLHVWSLGAGHDAITAHVKTSSSDPTFGLRLSTRIRGTLSVEYVTVQVEVGTEACDGERP